HSSEGRRTVYGQHFRESPARNNFRRYASHTLKILVLDISRRTEYRIHAPPGLGGRRPCSWSGFLDSLSAPSLVVYGQAATSVMRRSPRNAGALTREIGRASCRKECRDRRSAERQQRRS